MAIKDKWNELDKKKKVMVGIGSAVAVAAVGTGAVMGVTAADQPAQTKVAETPTRTETDKDVNDDKDKEKDKLDGKDTESEDVKVEDSTSDKKNEEKSEEKEIVETKETVTEQEDGTKVTVNQSTGNTPSATVKVEKKTETKTESSKPSTSTSNQSSTQPKESKPKDTITTKTTTSTETIAFQTVRQNDSSLEKGKEVVAQNGQNGTKTITYKETYTNGKLTSKNQVSSTVTKNPVDKIIKVGTKAPVSTKLSASEAHSVLGGSGMTKGGNTYTMRLADLTDVKVDVGSNGVSSIYFNGAAYIPWKTATKQELIEIFGEKEGVEMYNYGQSQAAKIEKAVRAAANAVYGSGTSQANNLYNQIINSGDFSKTF